MAVPWRRTPSWTRIGFCSPSSGGREPEGYSVDPRIIELKRPRVPDKEPTVYHINQIREILAACNPRLAQEELAVRILVGSGIRESELCGLASVWP
jgi:integrase